MYNVVMWLCWSHYQNYQHDCEQYGW